MDNYRYALQKVIEICAASAVHTRTAFPAPSPAEAAYLTGCRQTAELILQGALQLQANAERHEHRGPLH